LVMSSVCWDGPEKLATQPRSSIHWLLCQVSVKVEMNVTPMILILSLLLPQPLSIPAPTGPIALRLLTFKIKLVVVHVGLCKLTIESSQDLVLTSTHSLTHIQTVAPLNQSPIVSVSLPRASSPLNSHSRISFVAMTTTTVARVVVQRERWTMLKDRVWCRLLALHILCQHVHLLRNHAWM
jgi:hypothetical protein